MTVTERKDMEVLWTIRQVATHLTIHPNTVYRWIKEGIILDPLAIVRFGTRVRIKRSEVQRISEGMRSQLDEKFNSPAKQ